MRYDFGLACYDNDVDAFIPEQWARESIEILFEECASMNMVHRDFESQIANYGDVVNTRKPAESKIMRRTDSTVASGLVQDVSATNIPVKLDQWFNQTFVIRPGEMSKAFMDLRDTYLKPRLKVMARGIDRCVLGRAACAFGTTPATRAGKLQGLTAANAFETVVEVDKILNQNKAPQDDRKLIVSPASKAQLLLCDKFVKANERGDGGQTLATAKLGTLLNLETYCANNVAGCATGADVDVTSYTITEPHAAEYAAALECASISTDAVNGQFAVVAGNDQPTYITAHVDNTSVTLNEALKYATLDNAVLSVYKACAANATYAAGHSEAIVVKSYTTSKAPQVGQLIAFGTSTNRRTYTVIESTDSGSTCSILLDRPLEVGVSENDAVFPGPYGSWNLAMHKNALALVTRPLAMQVGAGMMCAVMQADGLGVRVSWQDVINEGRKVAIDILAGVAVLDSDLCVPVLG